MNLSLIPCDHVPAYGVEILKYIWVADQGIDANCNDTIEWHERSIYQHPFHVVYVDNFWGCDPVEPRFDLDGQITDRFQNGIRNVFVTLTIPGTVFSNYVTGSDGRYLFEVESINGEARISAERNDFHKNGVSTLDLVKIQKHLLGKELLDSPYRMIAADINNSWNVSAIDLVELRKFILGLYTEFPTNESWRFVRKDFVFQDFDPWSEWMSWSNGDVETITFTDPSNLGNLDFIGIKIGDVNGTANPNITQLLPREALPPFEFITAQQSFQAGEIINVPIRILSDQTLSGFQFTMSCREMEIIGIQSGKINIADEHYALFRDQFTISWFDENNVDVSSDDILFTVQVRAKEQGKLSQSLSINSAITEAELYLSNDITFQPVLHIEDQELDAILQITSFVPNPWKEEATVNFFLPKADKVTFKIFDISGRELSSTNMNLKGGYHKHQLKSSDFSERGMLFFEVSTSAEKAFHKMILLD